MSDSEIPWPSERGRYSGIVLQFGQTRAALLGWALTTGDPLADAVVEAIHAGGPDVRDALNNGIHHGLAALDDAPPEVAEFLRHTESRPQYADDDLLDHGSAPYFTVPNPVHIVSLSAGALIRVYESPSIAKVLATTGRLIDGADRRIRETGTWVTAVMTPGGLRPGGAAYVATLQVRMLHAHMRRLARLRSFDEARYGAPINQVDLARTWMDFTLTMLRAEEKMGFGLNTREITTIYRYWWLIAHLLGIDSRLVEGISSNEQADRVDALYRAVTGPLVDESVTLARATLESITDLLDEALHLPEAARSSGLHVLARRFHGDAVADELQIEDSAFASWAISAAIARARGHRITLRRDPARWAAEQKKNLEAAQEVLAAAGLTQYEADHCSAASSS